MTETGEILSGLKANNKLRRDSQKVQFWEAWKRHDSAEQPEIAGFTRMANLAADAPHGKAIRCWKRGSVPSAKSTQASSHFEFVPASQAQTNDYGHVWVSDWFLSQKKSNR